MDYYLCKYVYSAMFALLVTTGVCPEFVCPYRERIRKTSIHRVVWFRSGGAKADIFRHISVLEVQIPQSRLSLFTP